MPKGKKKTPLQKFKELRKKDPGNIPLPDVGETVNPLPGSESPEEMSEDEVSDMISEKEQDKKAEKAKILSHVDSQDWTRMDPVIPEELRTSIWVAVYKCPKGHKTKATNRQATDGVFCFECKEAGFKVVASIMPQFIRAPESDFDEKMEKRKKAKRSDQ